MRKYVPMRVSLQEDVRKRVNKENKFICFVSPGKAVREKTWTGFGRQSGLLGYDESDDVKDADNLPNVEDSKFVGSLLEEDTYDVVNEDEGAE